MPKVPWWAKLDGGDEAIESAAAFDNTPALRNTWMIANETRLKENPALYTSVTASRLPYAEARRLDAAYQSERALKSQSILEEAGIPLTEMDPRNTSPAKAAEYARQVKLKREQEQSGGFWSGVGNVAEAVGGAVGDAANWLWDAGKNVGGAAMDALSWASSPLTGPQKAGAANPSPLGSAMDALGTAGELGKLVGGIATVASGGEGKTVEQIRQQARSNVIGPSVGTGMNPLIPFAEAGVRSVENFATGVARIATGVDGQQAEDMRNAGYDPDSWLSRYGWYADVNSKGTPVSNARADQLKQQYNPLKVDMAREIATSGVIDDPQRVGGLSPEAQKLYANVTGGKDPEGNEILKNLTAGTWGTPGAELVEGLAIDPYSSYAQGVQAMGDLAAYWYTDPLAAAGTAAKGIRNARWLTDFEPNAVADAIMNKPKVARAWDDALDRIDRIHLLSQDKAVESQAQAAREFAELRQARPDMVPYYDTLLGMRRGSIKGAFFREDVPANGQLRDIADFRNNMIDIKRVSDPKDYKPMFQLREKAGQKVTQEQRDAAREVVAKNVSNAILANQILAGRPLIKNKMLMPGQVRLSYPLRKATRVFSDKTFRESGQLLRQLKDAEGKGIIDWAKADSADAALAGVVDSRKGGQWIRDNYTRGNIRSKAAYALSRFGVFRDAAVLKVDGLDTTKTFHDFVRPFVPRGQAAFLANRWAVSDPATRTVMVQNMFEMLANARHARNTRDGRDFWDQQLKGTQQPVPAGQTVKEAYSHSREKDLIQTPGGDVTAAMWSTQFADGVQLPSFLEVIRNTEQVGVISWLTGQSNGRLASQATRALKVGKVGTVSNALRQMLETRGMLGLEDPTAATRMMLTRLGLAGDHAAERADTNKIIRQARDLLKSDYIKTMVEAHGKRDYDAYANAARAALGKDLSEGLYDLLHQGVSVSEIAGSRSGFRLAATRFAVDPLRRKRAETYEKLTTRGGYESAPTKDDPFGVAKTAPLDPARMDHAYRWMDKVDTEFADKAMEAAWRQVGGQRAHYMDGARVDDFEQLDDGLKHGQRLSALRLTNTQDYLGAGGDSGALRWANALGQRLADPVGKEVLQAYARLAVHEVETRKLVAKSQDRIRKSYAKVGREVDDNTIEWAGQAIRASRPKEEALRGFLADRARLLAESDEHIDWLRRRGATKQMVERAIVARHLEPLAKELGDLGDPRTVARYLLKKTDAGQTYRLNGRRAQYLGGKYIADPAARDQALEKWADDLTEDAAHYMGIERIDSDSEFSPEQLAFWRKIAYGQPVTADDLARIAPDDRPSQVHAPVLVGKQFVEPDGGTVPEKLAVAASKYYNFAVARPLHRMTSEPIVVAAHREVMDSLEPLAKALADKGMSHQNIYNLLQTGAFGHAINRATRYMDNPHVTSYFAALSNNFLWFERSMEDFARRAMTVAKADPAVIARGYLLAEAAVHSGLIDKQVTTDEEGNAQSEHVFVYPGSGLMMRAVNEGLQALGIADSVKVPVWQDFTSPVKYLSPSLQNPIGFTTTPMLGMPLRVVKELWPETAPTVDSVLTTLEGGERSFGSQNVYQSFLPVYANRLWNTVDPDERSSQHASALRNALIYYQAAGLLPGPDATDGERARALDDISTMVQNNLIMRNVFGSFAPATPSTMGSNISGIGDDEINIIDRLRGVNTIRGEWFQLLEEYSNKFPADSNRAYSEASIEWLRRGHRSILNPEAFQAGSSGQPDTVTGGSFSSNRDLTQWMLDNREYMKLYGDVAYELIPAAEGAYYDQIGYRLQIRNGLRQQKNGDEMYDALLYSQANRDFYAARDARDEAIRQGADPQKAKAWFNEYTRQLETSNPVWASKHGEKSTPQYIAQHVAPSLRALTDAEPETVPAEIRELQPDLRVMARLYDDYQLARAQVLRNKGNLVGLAIEYGRRGDELFKGGPLNDLWSRMRVWED